MLKCDNCGEGNKGRYRSFDLEYEEGKKKWVTWCRDCLEGDISSTDKDKKMFEEISTPFWKHMGLKPKPKEIAFERYLKNRGMSWGDYRKEKTFYQAKQESAINQFNQHVKKYGTKNEPNPVFGKE